MENRYLDYLPDTVNQLQEFQKLGQIEGVFLEEAENAKCMLEDNQWIETARRNGLLRIAKMMKLSGAESMDDERLREEIRNRWNSHGPYTWFHLQDWLDSCLGEGNYLTELEEENYLLRLILELRVKEKKGFLEEYLRKILPANLMLYVLLKVNTHGDLQMMTHGQMKTMGWTYGQIPYEDLTVYQK